MDKSANVFGRFPNINSYAEAAFLSVDCQYRFHGIGSKLCTTAFNKYKEQNIPLVKALCSSRYSGKICERYGMKKIFSIPFSDMKLGDLPSLNIPPPHSIANVYCVEYCTQ